MLASRANLAMTVAALALVWSSVSLAVLDDGIDKNTTGLPTYPHLRTAMMDPVSRDTLGRQCIHYAAESPDPLEAVEAWYRKALPGSVESDVNKDSLYGSYFKLIGVKLAHGNDFLTIYRTADAKSTSIELFKCGGPAK